MQGDSTTSKPSFVSIYHGRTLCKLLHVLYEVKLPYSSFWSAVCLPSFAHSSAQVRV